MNTRNSGHTARQVLATSRAGTKDRVRALSSSGSDKKLSGRVAALFETGSDGVAWIGRNARVSEPDPMDDGALAVLGYDMIHGAELFLSALDH